MNMEENQPLKLWTMAHGHFLEMGGFTLVSDTIHQFKEPEQPRPMDKSGWLAGVLISLGWGSNNASSTQPKYVTQRDEYVRQRERCHLGALTFERFKELVCDDNFDFPAITSAEINDRSKGDGLSKLLAILQTSWFILQCIARVFQGLALTELELVTLAMASLNAITYAFWWSKPLSVREPVNVYVTERAGVVAETVNRNIDDEDVVYYTARDVTNVRLTPIESEDWCCALCLLPISLIFSITYPVFCLFPLGILFLLRIIKTKNVKKPQDDETVATRVVYTIRKSRYNLTHSIREYFGGREGPLEALQGSDDLSFTMQWFFVMPAYLFLLLLLLTILSPLFAIFFIASLIFTAAFKIVTTNRVPPGATHVPPFYAPRTNSDKYSRMIVFAVFGLIFGGIHCIAWDFAFPTDFERSLWRYTSLVLTAIPVVAAPIDCILENVNLNGRVGKMLRLLLGILMTALLFIYVPARLCLISQALALLRKQPDTVYVSVNWTKYIPHLFM